MLLEKNFTAKQFKKLLSLIDEQDSPKNVANMSGKINCFLAGFKTNSWIIDIGASNHMGFIKDVLFIPMFRYNLLSVSKLTKDLQCFASFYLDFFPF